MKQSWQKYSWSFAILIGSVVACADPAEPAVDVEGVVASGGTNRGAVTTTSRIGPSESDPGTSDNSTGGTRAVFVPNLGSSGSRNTVPDASETEDGTMRVSAAKAAEVLEDPEATCQGWSIEAEAENSVILFLVDVSGSMLESAPSTGGLSKWDVTRSALKSSILGLPSSVSVKTALHRTATSISPPQMTSEPPYPKHYRRSASQLSRATTRFLSRPTATSSIPVG